MNYLWRFLTCIFFLQSGMLLASEPVKVIFECQVKEQLVWSTKHQEDTKKFNGYNGPHHPSNGELFKIELNAGGNNILTFLAESFKGIKFRTWTFIDDLSSTTEVAFLENTLKLSRGGPATLTLNKVYKNDWNGHFVWTTSYSTGETQTHLMVVFCYEQLGSYNNLFLHLNG